MISRTPLLSVFIPAFNAGRYIREALESVLDNGCADFEVVIVDDGSRDDTSGIVESIGHPAVRLVRNSRNLGIALTRRQGVALLRGRYLALLDADDIALPGRFEAQVARLEITDGPDIIGGGVEIFGDQRGQLFFPASDAGVRAALLFHDCPLANPTVCMRIAPLREGRIGYSAAAGAACDYALWVDAMYAGLRFENLPRLLTRYRRHSEAMMRKSQDDWLAKACAVRRRVAQYFFPELTAEEQAALVDALSHNLSGGPRWFNGIYALSRAWMLARAVLHVDTELMMSCMENNLMRLLGRAARNGEADNEVLEMMTESSEHFARWRAARHGALDARIVELFAGAR